MIHKRSLRCCHNFTTAVHFKDGFLSYSGEKLKKKNYDKETAEEFVTVDECFVRVTRLEKNLR